MNRLGYYLREGVSSLFAHSLASLATVCIILACLLIMGTFASVALNVNYILDGLEDQVELLAFVDDSIPEEEARAMEGAIRSVKNVADAVFVSRAEALDSYLAQLEQSNLFDDLEPSVLRDRYVIYLEDIGIMKSTQYALADVPGIAYVNAHMGIAQGMIAVRRAVNIVCIAMVALLLVVSVIMMTNTLRLAAYTRRKEVAIEKMMGATNAFIRGPFNVQGMLLGLTGSLIAFLAQWSLYTVLARKLTESSLSFLHILPFPVLALPLLVCFVAVGLLVAIFGSQIAIRSYMRV